MPALLLFPAAVYAMLIIIYTKAFIRTTGLSIRIIGITAYSLFGAGATMITYIILLTAKDMVPGYEGGLGMLISPFSEELVKYLLLAAAVGRLLLAQEPLQRFRQRVLAGIILGLSFGLVETYLYFFSNITLFTTSMLLGSIPLHMVSGGLLGYISAIQRSGVRKFILVLAVIALHLGYNQIVQLPIPLSYISFLLLLAGAIFLLNSITSPRDYSPGG